MKIRILSIFIYQLVECYRNNSYGQIFIQMIFNNSYFSSWNKR